MSADDQGRPWAESPTGAAADWLGRRRQRPWARVAGVVAERLYVQGRHAVAERPCVEVRRAIPGQRYVEGRRGST